MTAPRAAQPARAAAGTGGPAAGPAPPADAPIHIRCQCGAHLKAARRLAGRAVHCPHCSRYVRIPLPDGEDLWPAT